jgi:hypothetical protein
MAAVFWDRKRVLMVEFMQQGTTISEVYCTTTKNCIRPIRTKGLECWRNGLALLYGIVHPHTAAPQTQALLEHFSLGLFDHPVYSLNLATSNHHCLPT